MRHATRAFDGDQLSQEGRAQALTLQKKLLELGFAAPTRLQSSPKTRTQQTLRPLASELRLTVEIEPLFDERTGGESLPAFEKRVRDCLPSFETSGSAISLACSHLDWLEAAALFLNSDEADLDRAEPWSPMAIRAYMMEDGIWKRRWG